MLHYLPQFYLLLTSLMISDVYAQSCTSGWFGDKCRFLCHCLNSKTCDMDGQCPNNDRCQKGYFGPACQYVDLVHSDVAIFVDAYLKDSNDTSCNLNATSTSVELSLKRAFPFSWFRIYAKKNLMNFDTLLNSGIICSNERKFPSSSTTVDVTCDVIVSVYRLRIEGTIAPHICSIYISGGRNVALKEGASQSSNLSQQLQNCQASNAVDGNTLGDISLGHCSSTALEIAPPQWHLHYSNPQILYEVRVYNRDVKTYRLQKFRLLTFTNTFTTITDVQDSSNTTLAVYRTIIASRTPVTRLTIIQSSHLASVERSLTLCEVETYGDTVCPEGRYGINCDKICKCKQTEVCNPITGVCAPGCTPGYYGYKCKSPCTQNCLHGICQHRSGNCFQCAPGYLGEQCDKECRLGTFGPQCMFNCSVHCRSLCSYTTGYCTCKDRYGGLLCTECRIGFYGTYCQTPCSHECRICEQYNGGCEECLGNRDGVTCQDCLPSYFGQDCEYRCSRHCVNRTCDRLTGHCRMCEYGYEGDQCKKESTQTWMYLFPVVVICMLVCLCGMKKAVEEQDDGTSTLSGDESQSKILTSSSSSKTAATLSTGTSAV